jgi:hypothetical protein
MIVFTPKEKAILFCGIIILGLFIVLIVKSFAPANHSGLSSNPDDTFLRQYVAEQRLKENLKDPASLEVISSEVDKDKNVTIRYRARNGFGGMSTETFNTR